MSEPGGSNPGIQSSSRGLETQLILSEQRGADQKRKMDLKKIKPLTGSHSRLTPVLSACNTPTTDPDAELAPYVPAYASVVMLECESEMFKYNRELHHSKSVLSR